MKSEELKKIEDFRHELLLIHVRLETLQKEINKEIIGTCSTIIMLRAELLGIINNHKKD